MSAGGESLFQYASWAAAIIGSFVGGIFMAALGLRSRLRSSDDEQFVTKYELMVAISGLKEEERRNRHELYGQMQRNTAAFELDLDRVNDNMTEGAKATNDRLRALEVSVARLQPRNRPAE